MNVITLYFAVWLISDLHVSTTTVALGNGVASALVMVSIPVFGALADVTQRRKPWVVGFTLLCVVATAFIGVFGQWIVPRLGDAVLTPVTVTEYQLHGGALTVILLTFIVANYAHQGTLPFYNAMMPELAPPTEWGRLSGLGAALAYVGSIVGVLMVMPFFSGTLPIIGSLPAGLLHTLRTIIPFSAHGGRVSTFVPTAILCLLFSLPLFVFCRDHFPVKGRQRIPVRQAFQDVAHTIREARKHPGTLRFVLASFVYQDAMGTIVSYMALYAVMAMGFRQGTEATLFLVLTIPAVIGSWIWGKLTDRIGPKRTLMLIIAGWIALLIALMLVSSQQIFWIVGALIGFIYGGVSVAERPMLLSLIPPKEAGQFFSLLVLSARASAIAGPLIWGFAVDRLTPITGKDFAYRAAVGTVMAAMLIALFILRGIPDRRENTQHHSQPTV